MLIFDKNLREVRLSKGITQQQLADELGIDLRSYQKWEYGVHLPTCDILLVLADI